MAEVRLLAAPVRLLAKVSQVRAMPPRAYAQLLNGPKLYFGAGISSPRNGVGGCGAGQRRLRGADYIDVSVASRPARDGRGHRPEPGHGAGVGTTGGAARASAHRWRRHGGRTGRYDRDSDRRVNLRSSLSLVGEATLRYRREFGDLQRSLRKHAHG